MQRHTFTPKLFTVWREGFTKTQLTKDLLAGLIVGIVALPLSIAFAIASGVKPEQGLITAVVAGLLISVFSGSRVQIGGPTGAFVVIIYGIVARFGYDGLAVATLMAGVILVGMGIFRLGTIIQFIPYPVTVGFTGGIALIIFSGQIRDLLGLPITNLPAHFVEQWKVYFENFSHAQPISVLLGLLSIAIILLWPRVTRRIPGSFVAILLTTALVHLLHLPVATIGSRFGEVAHTVPHFHFPTVSWEVLPQLFSPALSIALLAGIESLLSAVVSDGMIGARHRSSMELIAQGIGNLGSILFGGIPATGAIARTATNVKNGGRTPVAGIVHAITLFLILLLFGKWASLIPLTTLAAILIVVAYHMSEWRLFIKILKSPKSDIAVLAATFLLTIFVDLIVSIQVGVVMASLLFMKRMANVSQASIITKQLAVEKQKEEEGELDENGNAIAKKTIPPGVEVFEINGPLFFGAADQFKDTLQHIKNPPKILILRMRFVPMIDATALQVLEDLFAKTRREKTTLLLSGVQPAVRNVLMRSGLLDKIGLDNIFENVDIALAHANQLLTANQVSR